MWAAGLEASLDNRLERRFFEASRRSEGNWKARMPTRSLRPSFPPTLLLGQLSAESGCTFLARCRAFEIQEGSPLPTPGDSLDRTGRKQVPEGVLTGCPRGNHCGLEQSIRCACVRFTGRHALQQSF